MAESIPIIGFANQKGGVGKSSITLQHAYYLQRELDKPVLVIDLDAQGSLSVKAIGDDPASIRNTRSVELFNDADVAVDPYVTEHGFHIVYNHDQDKDLAGIVQRPLSETLPVIRENIQRLRNSGKYSVILIDCPPALGPLQYAAVYSATHIFTVVEVAAFAVNGLTAFGETVEEMSGPEMNPELEHSGVIVNKLNIRSDTHKRSLDMIREVLGDLVLPQSIGFRSSIDESSFHGTPLYDMKKGSARLAAKEVREVVLEVSRRSGLELPKGNAIENPRNAGNNARRRARATTAH